MHNLIFKLHFLSHSGLNSFPAFLKLQIKLHDMHEKLRWILVCMLALAIQNYSYSQPDRKAFKLALVQMEVVGGDREANLRHAGNRIEEAVSHGAQLLLLPEAMDLGWTDPSALTEAERVPEGKTAKFLSQMALKHGVYICSGLTEKEGNKVYNSAVILDPEGKVILLHRKINELDIGHKYYSLGQSLQVVQTELGALGLIICADASTGDREILRSLSYMGADVILSPSSWAVSADHNNEDDPYGDLWRKAYKPVAKDFRVWIASCSNVGWMTGGPWKGAKAIGCSMVIAPGGEEVLNAPYGDQADTILYIDIGPEPRPAQGTTWHQYWKKQ